MENFAALIKQRRSTRQFTSELLTPNEVELILKAALMAPASKRCNPWQFVVVENKETLRQLAECKDNGSGFVQDCALAVVVLADVTVSDVWVEDASIAAIYMQLQAEDLGLGSCWCQVRNRVTKDDEDANEYVRRLFNIPYQLEVLAIVAFGHKAQERKPFNEEHLQWDKVHVEKFQ